MDRHGVNPGKVVAGFGEEEQQHALRKRSRALGAGEEKQQASRAVGAHGRAGLAACHDPDGSDMLGSARTRI